MSETASVTPGDSEIASLQQYIGFRVGGLAFAAPLNALQEIIRIPVISHVPLSPPSLRGLANFRGTVLPIINLHAVFDLAEPIDNPAARVLVVMLDRPIGFMVDSVADIFDVDTAQGEGDLADAKIDKGFLSGVIRQAGTAVMLVNFNKIVQQEFAARSPRQSARKGEAAPESDTDDDEINIQLVTFVVDEQEYAFHIDQVEEILFLPEKILQVPNAHDSIAGVIYLHDRLLPVFHLRPLLSLPQRAATAQSRVIVISLSIDGSTQQVGLIIDAVTEILHARRDVLDKVPKFLGHEDAHAEITAICRIDDGQRLVSVLSPEALFGAEPVQMLIQSLRESDNRSPAAEEDEVEAFGETQLLIFRLVDEVFGLPIQAVQEIVRMPAMAPVPHAPDFIAGVFNLRGMVVPVVNQRQRFGLPASPDPDSQRIMVLEVKGIKTGFVVDAITEVIRVSDQAFESTPDPFQAHMRMVQQVAHLNDGRMILMFDPEQLLDSVDLKALNKAGGRSPKKKPK